MTTPRGRIRGWRWRSWTAVAAALAGGTVILLLWSLAAAWQRPPMTPDSWDYLLLARSFHGTAYSTPLIRQYEFNTSFGDSFPPVWPLLIYAGAWLLGDGPRLGIVVAAVLSLVLLPLLHVLVGRFVGPTGRRRVAAAACWAALLSFGPFLDEIVSGRSIPAALLWYAVLAIVLTRMTRLSLGGGVLTGAIAGLLWMTRFDAAPVVLLVGLLVPFAWGDGSRFRWWAGYGLALAIVLAPWVVYSRRTFGVNFASDNAMVARLVVPAIVSYWFPTRPLTVKDAPMAWALRLLHNTTGLFASMWRAVTRYAYATSLTAIFAGWTLVQPGNSTSRPTRAARIALLITFALACQLAGPLAIGIFDLRYLAQFILAISLWTACLALTSRTRRFRGMLLAPLAIGLMLGWRKSFGAERGQRATFAAVAPPQRPDRWPDAAGVSMTLLRRCLPADARLLVAEPGVPSYLVAFYLGRTSLELPDNWLDLSRADRSEFLARFHVTHVIDPANPPIVPVEFSAPIDGCGGLRAVITRTP